VRNVESIETLGATSCICVDKTGTMSQNKMNASNLWYDLKTFSALNRAKENDHSGTAWNPTD